jgi:hypothetical protein
MDDKIALLIEETGCEPSEAELALSLSGFDVPRAVRLLERMLKNILVLSGKFRDPARGVFGLFLAVLDVKTASPLRTRALLSLDPAVHAEDLAQDWFDFERQIYGLRLGEGSLLEESLSLEHGLLERLRVLPRRKKRVIEEGPLEAASREAASILRALLDAPDAPVILMRKLISLSHYRELKGRKTQAAKRRPSSAAARESEILVLDVRMTENSQGVPARELRSGDIVWVSITDHRDVAQYLARLLGAVRDGAPSPIEAAVEAVEAVSRGVLVRVRLSGEVCGDAMLSSSARIHCLRQTRFYSGDGLTMDEK